MSPFVVLESGQQVFDLLQSLSSVHSENLVTFITICTSATLDGGCGGDRGNEECTQEVCLHDRQSGRLSTVRRSRTS